MAIPKKPASGDASSDFIAGDKPAKKTRERYSKAMPPIRLGDTLNDRLRSYAATYDLTFAQIVRRALTEFLDSEDGK